MYTVLVIVTFLFGLTLGFGAGVMFCAWLHDGSDKP